MHSYIHADTLCYSICSFVLYVSIAFICLELRFSAMFCTWLPLMKT